jgi:hypothetical protein
MRLAITESSETDCSACRPKPVKSALLPFVMLERTVSLPPGDGRWGVETPAYRPVANLEAGWHARMSSRLAGKGACACVYARFPTSGFGRRSEWT